MGNADVSAATERDDRVELITRVVAFWVALSVFLGFAVLYVFPERTATLWAWPVKPTTTAMLMGTGYMAGAYFFVRVVSASRWHRVSLGFIPVTVFASSMMLATLLHWDRFNHQHIVFHLWLGLYIVTPILVPAIWLRNRRRDPGPTHAELMLPRPVRVGVGALGVAQLLFVIWMFARPDTVIPWWPWKLTPLTARAVASFYSLTAVIAIAVAVDGRWAAARIPLQSALVGLGLMLLALPRARGDIDTANPLAWSFAVSLLLLVVVVIGLLVFMDARQRRLTSGPPAAAP